ncbi:MAG: hypothetical protein JOZ18_14265, partial [Chloroflexi bacterium]|nr:hypothetical protein [Chloroflexota bacterium]
RTTQFLSIAQTILPFILVLLTCAILFTAITPRGGAAVIQGEIVALLLAIIVIARQALTLIENNRLTLQIRSELVLSRRELHIKRADDASLRAQEKLILEKDAAALRATHKRVARGDLAARAPAISGPLQPVALSLNLMLDRLGSIAQQSSRYAQLAQELKMVQEAIERLEQGMPPWTSTQPPAQCTSDFRAIFTDLLRVQRTQGSEWRNLRTALESVNTLLRQLRQTLTEIKRSKLFADLSQSNFERMILELVIRQAEVLEQQQKNILNQVAQSMTRYEARTIPIPAIKPADPPHP